MGITLVPKAYLVVGRLVQQGQGLVFRYPALDEFDVGGGVAGGLFGHTPEIRTFPLGLDDAACLAVDEEQVVGGTGVGVHLTYRHAQGFVKVDSLFVLDDPARVGELAVDCFAGLGFEEGLFGRCHGLHHRIGSGDVD